MLANLYNLYFNACTMSAQFRSHATKDEELQCMLPSHTLIKLHIHGTLTEERALRADTLPVVGVQARLSGCHHGGAGPRHDPVLVSIERGSNVAVPVLVTAEMGHDKLHKL